MDKTKCIYHIRVQLKRGGDDDCRLYDYCILDDKDCDGCGHNHDDERHTS